MHTYVLKLRKLHTKDFTHQLHNNGSEQGKDWSAIQKGFFLSLMFNFFITQKVW